LRALRFDKNRLDDVTTAAGEALSNVVEHAYPQRGEGAAARMELLARIDSRGTLVVDVCDRGTFIFRDPLPERGFGLRIIRAIARRVSIETADGTRVRMTFDGTSDAGS
jgi:anti-sigma regulatory factor (Ser/Thr protein kinase)